MLIGKRREVFFGEVGVEECERNDEWNKKRKELLVKRQIKVCVCFIALLVCTRYVNVWQEVCCGM